jgi:hypothetical protein
LRKALQLLIATGINNISSSSSSPSPCTRK